MDSHGDMVSESALFDFMLRLSRNTADSFPHLCTKVNWLLSGGNSGLTSPSKGESGPCCHIGRYEIPV